MALSLLSATPFLLLFYKKIAHVYEILGNLWIRSGGLAPNEIRLRG
jgi:hypothetical protein